MAINLIPADLAGRYEFWERRHALAILATDFPNEWADIQAVLNEFRLMLNEVRIPGGSKSPVSKRLEDAFERRDWVKRNFRAERVFDTKTTETRTHEVDCFKNRIALEIEWSSKDSVFDRDLSCFRSLFEADAISVGIFITKSEVLKDVFKRHNVYGKFGASTTWMDKLRIRVESGGAGGCPLLAIGLTRLHEDS